MQSDYEIAGILPPQQFMDTDCCSSVFPLPTSPMANHPDPLHQNHHAQLPYHSQQQKQPHFHMNHPVHPGPITHQFFQPRHQFQTLQPRDGQQGGRLHQQLRLEQEAGHSPNHFLPLNFKLGLNENSCREECGALNGDLLNGNEPHVPHTRPHSLGYVPKCWQTQDFSTAQEPSW